MKPWVAWPILIVVLVFGWHWRCLPESGVMTNGGLTVRSVNFFTNTVIIDAPPATGAEQLGYAIATPAVEEALERKARENFDLWGMLLGYNVRIEAG